MEGTVNVKFHNSQETFSWLESNIGSGWFVWDENMEHVEIAFYSDRDARYARESLPALN